MNCGCDYQWTRKYGGVRPSLSFRASVSSKTNHRLFLFICKSLQFSAHTKPPTRRSAALQLLLLHPKHNCKRIDIMNARIYRGKIYYICIHACIAWAETLRWTGGRSPSKFEVGDGPCIRPPIFREVGLVLSDACESKKWVKKGVMKEFLCSEIEVFHKEKGHICCISDVRQ